MDEFYCSNCNEPVNENDKICKSCGAELNETIENPDEQNSVSIRTYITMFEAEAVQEYLRGCGIDAYLSKDDAGGMYPLHFSGINNIKLLVLESKKDEALKALDALENNESEIEDDSEGE